MMQDEPVAEWIRLDFEQARAKHLLFKARLRSFIYGAEISEGPVVSHLECTVGKWLYGHALQTYAGIPEVHRLEQVHKEVHVKAQALVQLYKEGRVEEARRQLPGVEEAAGEINDLLIVIESKVKHSAPAAPSTSAASEAVSVNLHELQELLRLNVDLDRRIRQNSRALYEAKERFDLVAKATQDAIWDWDLTTNLLWWNEGFKDLFGYKDEDIEPDITSWYNRVHPDDREHVIGSIHKVIDNGGRQWTDEYRFRKSDGSYATVFDRGYALHDAEGRPVRMLGSMQDITERKQAHALLEQRVQERTYQLEQRNRELEQFTYVSHHDLQEPLRKIIMFSDMVKGEAREKLSEAAQSRLEKVTAAASRMSAALRDVLNYASLSKQEQNVEIDLDEVLAAVQADLELVIHEKAAHIEADELPTVKAVPGQMHQLFYNLLNNALKFAKAGEPPVVRITCQHPGRELLTRYPELDATRAYYLIAVRDNGIGFRAEWGEKIFHMFQRLHNRDAYAGTGIGLALCKKVVANHRGIIWTESEPGEGATFKVLLPA